MHLSSDTVEQWDFVELALSGPSSGNPFVEVEIAARFVLSDQTLRVPGFYDGEGTYRIRFMPPAVGCWTFETESNIASLAGRQGKVSVIAPTGRNRGPVRVAHTFHFVYADGTPYRQVGTTSYAWTHQSETLELQTLATLKNGPFNKIRMCVFPKNYAFNSNDPPRFPFEGAPPNRWDTTRFNPEFFQHFEKRVGQLREMGIEADVILFHPYDKGRWGFDRMDAESDDRYLRYVVARLSGYRNVWWSLANEYDFMKEKTPADWDRCFQVIQQADPYDHLRSIHNGTLLYDHNRPWVTHASIQNGMAVADFGRAMIYRDCYRKPVVYDEVKYEGNIPQRWGNLSAEELVHRFWQGLIGGAYVGHGETFMHPDDVIWWARGGSLHGQSPARLAFLRQIMEDGPAEGIDPIDKWQDLHTAGKAGEYYLVYFGYQRPESWRFELPRQELGEGMRFTAELIDTWNMTITPVEGEFEIVCDDTYRYHSKNDRSIALPGRPFMAIRLKRVTDNKRIVVRNDVIFGEG